MENSKNNEYDYIKIDSLISIKGVTFKDLISHFTGIHKNRLETKNIPENKKYDIEYFGPNEGSSKDFNNLLKKEILEILNYSETEYLKDIIGYEVTSIDTLFLIKSFLEPNSKSIVTYISDEHIFDIQHYTIQRLFTLLTNKQFPFVIFSNSKIEGYYDFKIRNIPNEGTFADLEKHGIKLTKILKKVPHYYYQKK
ncbi:hypothetical protein [Lacihabitans sp. LS3-19]|uniref:hypothetical protein n=1 Tax=Lacihabitans sp. LS3-19 TaxID=2487335 RepID=UPI0020CC4DF1|nr:hypothetical protein [Lacihabitans sp. LS3-19]